MIGGLEKEDRHRDINYEADNHALMTRLRGRRIAGIADEIGELAVDHGGRRRDARPGLGVHLRRDQGSGAASAAARREGRPRSPVPPEPAARATPARWSAPTKVLIPETNTGQLCKIIRAEFLVDAERYNKVEGLPIFAEELDEVITERM